MGRDLISVTEDYWEHDGNPQSESQVKLKSKDWGKHKHIVDSDITKFEDWDDDPDFKDAKVSIDELQEKMYELEDFTQSVYIAANLPILEDCDDEGFAKFEVALHHHLRYLQDQDDG